MAKAPSVGNVKTRLTGRYTEDAVVALYGCLLQDTISLACSVPKTVVALMCPASDSAHLARWGRRGVSVVEQEGQGLAAGLVSTFNIFLAASYRRVVAFNSDSPHLPRPVLESAFALLDAHDLVVGPTDDGGYYLVGAKAAYPSLFDDGRLGTQTALQALLSRARDLGLSVAFTDEWYDVDVPEDVARLAADLRQFPERAPCTSALLASLASFTVGHPRTPGA